MIINKNQIIHWHVYWPAIEEDVFPEDVYDISFESLHKVLMVRIVTTGMDSHTYSEIHFRILWLYWIRYSTMFWNISMFSGFTKKLYAR